MTGQSGDTAKLHDRMLKCLELTSSDNDAEALLALRKANQLRAKLGLRWAGLVTDKPAEEKGAKGAKGANGAAAEAERAEPEQPAGEYDYAPIFALIYRAGILSDKWLGVCKGLEEYWHTVGRLSEKQHNLLMRFYASAVDGGRS